MSEEIYYCSIHDEIECPTISISIEFEDGEVWDELTELDSIEEVEDYIKETIEEKFPNDKVKEYSYGLYCPYCLESLE